MKPVTNTDIRQAIKTIVKMKLQGKYPDMPKERWTEIKTEITDASHDEYFSSLYDAADCVIGKVFGDIERLGVHVDEARNNPLVDSAAYEQAEQKYKEFTGSDVEDDSSVPF